MKRRDERYEKALHEQKNVLVGQHRMIAMTKMMRVKKKKTEKRKRRRRRRTMKAIPPRGLYFLRRTIITFCPASRFTSRGCS